MRGRYLVLAISAILGMSGPVAANSLSGSYLAGRQAGADKHFEKAAVYFDRALVHAPDRAELLERAALAYLSIGDVDRAFALAVLLEEQGQKSQVAQLVHAAKFGADENFQGLLDRITNADGVGPLVNGLSKAWVLLGLGDLEGALNAFDDAGTEPGFAGFAQYHKALALASVGDFEAAETLFAADTMGGLQITRRGIMARAEILSQLDRASEAVALIDTSFGAPLDPGLKAMRSQLTTDETLPFTMIPSPRSGLAEVFYSVAEAISNDADDDFTLLYARVALHLRPDHADAVLMTAELLEQLGRFQLAVDVYQTLPQDDFAFHAAELGRAGALRASGRVEDAVDVLEQLSETHGDMPIVHSTLADTLRQLERFEEAAEAYDLAIALYDKPDQSQWFLHYARGITRERLDQWNDAEADLRRALELRPDQPQVLNYLGYSMVEKQINLDEALQMIERAVAARPNSGYIVDSLGWVLFRLGRYEEAVPHMERAAELMAIDPIVNDHLGDVYWAVGRTLEAQFQWKRALSFADRQSTAEEVQAARIRKKLEVGLDKVLEEEGAAPLSMANDNN